MKLQSYFLVLIILLSNVVNAHAYDDATVTRVSESKMWKRLLHYKPNFPFGKIRSHLDGPDFFFAQDGKTNPRSEVIASADAFSKDILVGRRKQHPQCAFPERYKFLKKELGLQIKDVECPLFKDFMQKFNPQSATLVFSSAYPNNPGSMFGHTFLRINAKPTEGFNKLDILDYGLSFAAAVGPDENSFAFMYFGLTGGYIGQFSMLPYYVKVNEYNNSESRDIWEYDLNLNQEETERLLRHVWEIETNSWFDYYFFDENCAYQLMTLLEVAKPDWDISEFFIYVIPGETVKRVVDVPGAIKSVKFRPSLRKKMLSQYGLLDSEEKSEFSLLTESSVDVEMVKKASALDAAASYFYYLKQKGGSKLDADKSKRLQEILARRAEIGGASVVQKVEYPEDSRPDKSHHPRRLTSGHGVAWGGPRDSQPQYFQDLHFKFAYHDLMNDDTGYTKFSHVDFPGFTLRYFAGDKKLNLEAIHGLALTSLFPVRMIEKTPSWKLLLDYYSPRDFSCDYCHVVRAEAGGGYTFELFNPDYYFYFMGTGSLETGTVFKNGIRFMPKFNTALLMHPFSRYKLRLAGTVAADLFQSDRQKVHSEAEINQSIVINQSFEIRNNTVFFIPTDSSVRSYRETSLSINWYF